MKKAPHHGRAGKENTNTFSSFYSSRSRSDVHTIKAAIHPADFYHAELPEWPRTKKGGWCDGGLCPFHDDHHAGSFRVNFDTGAYKCFSCGASGGDVIAFTMERDGLSFPQALKRLSEDWNV